MQNLFLAPDDAARLVRTGVIAVFSGSETALRRLPAGNWIGGTTPYFMTDQGGREDTENLFCTVLTDAVTARSAVLDVHGLSALSEGRFDNGFSYLLLPAFAEVHRRFSIDGPSYPGLCDQPVMGWVTGVLVAEIGTTAPKVFDGFTGKAYADAGVILHVQLPNGTAAGLDIINLFEQGDGPEIVFSETGFSATDCQVDGIAQNFAHYVKDNGIDTRLPLVADYAGARVNVSVQSIDATSGVAAFYAPVVAAEIYRIAKPVEGYERAFDSLAIDTTDAAKMLACNCILNYLYAQLEGKRSGGFVGPVTFGEIAYVLLNQTLVRLDIHHVAQNGGAD